jgi:subtilisin family serine protease
MPGSRSPFRLRRLALLVGAAASLSFGSGAIAAADTTRVIVTFKPGAAAAIRQAVAASRGAIPVELPGFDAMAIEVPSTALAGLRRNPNVVSIEEDPVRRTLALTTPSTGTPYTAGQLVPYGIAMVQADQLAATNAGNRKLCIIDSGYDRAHEDLSAGLNVTGEFDSGTGWWYTDQNHHGTHVAGTISALNNGGGVVGVSANQSLRLHIVKVFGASGWAYSSSLSAAALKCRDAGANVISMSLGGSVKSGTEQRVFDSLYNTNGILSIAAAGNDGNSRVSYPAGYGSVVSVAAVDEFGRKASFSQFNNDVEISGPGVGVLSTVPMGTGSRSTLSVGTAAYAPGDMDGSPKATATAPLADFGIGDTVNGSVAGKVCLIARGTVDFATKVSNCQASGGVGAVVYNNAAGGFSGTLGTTVTSIPSVTASDTEGAALKTQLGQSATVAVAAWNYAYFDGTSMATPHVSAVAALVWSRNPGCTAAQLRNSLNRSAKDLGAAGRDTSFGFGLVQAKAADDRIKALGCGA